MIAYIHKSGTVYNIRLDGKKVGEIRKDNGKQWQYFPKGKKDGGEPFPTFQSCFNSLNEEAQ